MVRADIGNRYSVLDRYHQQDRIIYDQRVLLRMRSDLRSDLVPLPSSYEDPMLYHLPDLQLGSPDDVLTADLYGWILCCVPSSDGADCLARLGALHYDVPGTLLG